MNLGILFDVASLKEKIDELENETTKTEFWNDTDKAQEVLSTLKELKTKFGNYMTLKSNLDDMETMIELMEVEKEESLKDELNTMYDKFNLLLDHVTIDTLLSDKYDKSNAIVTLHSGAGGTEACDWVLMLYRMYSRWCEKNNFAVEIIDELAGDEAGIKSITFRVRGVNAFGYLKSEKGVHRLVRISPFDSNKRRHTSFASCDVLPEIDEDINIVVRDEDIRVDVYRASGAGGQHVNKTESAVRITHLPTGIVVTSQNERSQIQNRDLCLKILKSKLYELEVEKNKQNVKDIQGELTDIGWGSQIRSYVFQPYSLVKDARTGIETGNTSSVMDGEIDIFINGYLKMNAMNK